LCLLYAHIPYFCFVCYVLPCQAYEDLTNDKKDSFIKLFEKNRGNLNWVHEFTEKNTTFNKVETGTEENFLNRNQIFRLNGFDPRDFADEDAAARMLKLLIKQSEELNGYTSTTQEHADEPLLNLYFYIHSKGVKRTAGNEDAQTFDGTAQVTKQMAKSMAAIADGDGVQLKYENEHVLKVKELGTVLNTAKVVLKKLLDQAADYLADLKAKKDSNTSAIRGEVEAALSEANDFLVDLRDKVAQAQVAELQPDEAKPLAEAMQLLVQKGLVHTEGLKLKNRQMKTFL
jgi:hypothetical protein